MLVIGGFGTRLHNDVWEYAPPNVGTWRELSVSGAPMPARAQHAAVYDPVRDRVVVLGGDGGMFLNDVWALNLGPTPGWERLAPAGAPPSARREHSVIYDPIGDRIIVYGGFDGTACADVWALSLAGAPAWSRPMVAGPTPAGRYGHAAVYDPSRRRMIVYGGTLEGNRIAQEMWALDLSSPTAVQATLEEVELGPRRVRLIWSGERLGSAYARLYRADGDEAPWVELGTPGFETQDRLRFEDRSVEPGRRYGYRLLVSIEGGAHGPIDSWVTVPEGASLELIGASPNPAAGELHVAFSLADDGAARLELFDLAGRRVASHEVGHMGAGWHRVPLTGGERLPAGVYLVRLTQRDQVLQRKALVVR
jgi:hypothetical protein